MAKSDWFWMGRPAHFICADRCHFRLATYIPKSKVIVSTVGDYDPETYHEKRPADIGCNRKYETFVFHAHAAKDCDGCAWHIDPSEIDSLGAMTANDATKNHYALCAKWDRKAPAKREETGNGK